MGKVNTYGIKMNGLRKACGETKCLNPYDGYHFEIAYDPDTGDVLTSELLSHSSFVKWNDGIIPCGNVYGYTSMQDIADNVYLRVHDMMDKR